MDSKTKQRSTWVSKNGPCVICGSEEELNIHHMDPDLKTAEKIWGLPFEKREEELSRCIVVCHECHVDIHSSLRRQKRKTRIHPDRATLLCRHCGEEKPIGSKKENLCETCWKQEKRHKSYIICKDCGEKKHPYTTSLCNACYSKRRRKDPPKRRQVICRVCGENKYHEADNMCKSCYIKEYRKRAPLISCLSCGERRQNHSGGLCATCYMRQKRLKAKSSETQN